MRCQMEATPEQRRRLRPRKRLTASPERGVAPLMPPSYTTASMKARRDRVELRAQACADGGQRADDDDGNKGRDQTVFDRRRAGLVAQKASKRIVHKDLHIRTPTNVRLAACSGFGP